MGIDWFSGLDMELSDDLFTDIRRTLGLDASSSAAPDAPSPGGAGAAKRRASRADASRARAEIEVPGSFISRHRVTLIDLSPRGVSFFDTQPWGAGKKLVMYLPRFPEHVIPLLCIVRYSRVIEGFFRIGVEFVNHYEAGSAMSLLDDSRKPADAAVEIDPIRGAPRKRFNRAAAPAQLHIYEMETAGPIIEADVVDLSDGGVGLVCAFQLPPGRKIMVRLCPPDGKPMTRMCEVVSCRRDDACGYRIGTRFIEYKPSRSLPQTIVGWLRPKR
jgi:hypothetical protein